MTHMLIAKNTGWFRKAKLHIAGRSFVIPARQVRYVGPYPEGTRWRSEGALSVEAVRVDHEPTRPV